MVLDGCIVDTNKANCDPIVFMSLLRTVCVEVVEQQAAILNPLYLLEKHSSWYAIQKKSRGESWSFEGFFYLIHQIAGFPAFWNLNDTFKAVLLQKGLESLGVNTSWKMFIWINVSCPDSNRLPFARSLHSLSLCNGCNWSDLGLGFFGPYWTSWNLSQQSNALQNFQVIN